MLSNITGPIAGRTLHIATFRALEQAQPGSGIKRAEAMRRRLTTHVSLLDRLIGETEQRVAQQRIILSHFHENTDRELAVDLLATLTDILETTRTRRQAALRDLRALEGWVVAEKR
jgi:hypothetical protein